MVWATLGSQAVLQQGLAMLIPGAKHKALGLAMSPGCTTWQRGLATGAPVGFIEVREYTLQPGGLADYMKLTAASVDVRKEHLPFLGMFTTDLGGPLTKVTHLYAYSSFDERDARRAAAARDPRWARFVSDSRAFVAAQTSKILLEAVPVYEALKLPPTRAFQSPSGPATTKVVYEQRSYQLHPGYGSVPKLVQAFAQGLPDKVAADPEGKLVLFGYTDVGMLNGVVELWRYPSAQACIRARQAARNVPAWRDTISTVTPSVQHFVSEFMHPTAFSPWQ